jgi:hypothetical protein
MSSEQRGQEIVFSCDNCEEERAVSSHSFKEAWEYLKDDGWRCFKNSSGDWEHRCPDCIGK